MKSDIQVDIVVPLYNEEKQIAKSVEELVDFLQTSGFPYTYKITLANNASTDRSLEICRELERKYEQVRTLDLGAKGKGLAVRSAWTQSEAPILTVMDCDLASDIRSFRALVDEISSGRAQISMGNRLGKNSKVISRHPTRDLMSKVYNFMTRLLLGTPFDDHQCGFKAVDRETFRSLSSRLIENGWLFDSELLAHAHKDGRRISSIDIHWREGEDSKVKMFSDSTKMFMGLLSLRKRL